MTGPAETAPTAGRAEAAPAAESAAPPRVSLADALRFWLVLGFISFGGPAGQIAILHAELVERRRWISERRFLHAMNYCMLLPGPEAQQLATYIGWLLHGTWGGIAAGALFVLPSLAILVALSWGYMVYGQLPLVAGLLYGVKPAVVALVAHAGWRVGRRTLRGPAMWALALGSWAALSVLGLPFPAIVLAAGLIGAAGARWRPAWFGPAAAAAAAAAAAVRGPAAGRDAPALIDDDTPAPPHARCARGRLLRVVLTGLALWALPMAALLAWQGAHATLLRMGLFFSQAALVTFGGAYAVLPYVAQGAVQTHQWLSAAQMMDGLALGESTPGPLIMVVAFVAYIGGWTHQVLGPGAPAAGGALAAVLVTYVTFLPSFVFILAGGPLVEATKGRLGFTAPLQAISAAVVGVIAVLALFFARHVLWPAGFGAGPDFAAAAIAAAAAVALWRFQLGVPWVLAGAALAGLALRSLA